MITSTKTIRATLYIIASFILLFGHAQDESFTVDKGNGYAKLQLVSGGDGTNNNATIKISAYGYGGTSNLSFENPNWGGGYFFKRNASGGYFNQVGILHGGGAGAGFQTGYGILDVYGPNSSIGIRLNAGGSSYFLNGNLGIGTSSPGAPLEVSGEANQAATILGRENLIGFKRADGALVYGIGHTNNEFVIGSTQNLGPSAGTPMQIGTGGSSIRLTQGSEERMRIANNGNVGIGTTLPSEKLQVMGGLVLSGTALNPGGAGHLTVDRHNGNTGRFMINGPNNGQYGGFAFIRQKGDGSDPLKSFVIDDEGNLGVGVDNPIYRLDLNGDLRIGNDQYLLGRRSDGNTSKLMGYLPPSAGENIISISEYTTLPSEVRIFTPSDQNQGVSIYSNQSIAFFRNDGHVGIGTTNPSAKLTVDGDILAEKVKVVTSVETVPDYVFKEDYELRSLEEVTDYVKTNSHLPEVPSAEEIAADGHDLAAMNLLLLKKIEELTLYVIEQNERVTHLEEENKILKKYMTSPSPKSDRK